MNKKSRKRRSKRRKHRNQNVNSDSLCIMHTNIRGFKSKCMSLNLMLSGVDILTINETRLNKNENMKIQGFKPFLRNRPNAQGGGVATCVWLKDY